MVQVCTSGSIVASSKGIAGCFTLVEYPVPTVTWTNWSWNSIGTITASVKKRRIRTGVGYTWGPPRKGRLLGDTCDIKAYEVKAANVGTATAMLNTVSVAPKTAVLSLLIAGSTAPPLVKITPPTGSAYTTPAVRADIDDGVVWATDPATKTTRFQIGAPAAGTWKIDALSGSTILNVKRSVVETPPSIVGEVAPVVKNGSPDLYRRKFVYAYQPQPGHQISFVEHGDGYAQDIGNAAGTPAQAPRRSPRGRCAARSSSWWTPSRPANRTTSTRSFATRTG